MLQRYASRRTVPVDTRASYESPDHVDVLTTNLTARLDLAPSPPAVPRSEDGNYAKWQMRYPNALRQFGKIEDRLKGKRLAVFLDYDGTLTPIVNDPDRAIMAEDMRTAVRELAEIYPTAIISGRGLEKVQGFVQLKDLYYAGSHGLDIRAPTGPRHHHHSNGCVQPAEHLKPLINDVYHQLCDAIKHIHGAHVEHNTFCLSVHFRNCDESAWEEIKSIVKKIVASHGTHLKSTRGRKVLEIRPSLDWGKGKAVEHFLKAWCCQGDDVVPIYLGDDRTDEDAFQFLRKQGNGFGILVSTKAKPSDAEYSLRDPSEVLQFLLKLVEWNRKTQHTNIIGRFFRCSLASLLLCFGGALFIERLLCHLVGLFAF